VGAVSSSIRASTAAAESQRDPAAGTGAPGYFSVQAVPGSTSTVPEFLRLVPPHIP
jgi:hypothetical protein